MPMTRRDFLAGMPGKPGSPFAELESTEAWKENRQLLDQRGAAPRAA